MASATLNVNDLIEGGAPELVVDIEVQWSYIPSADDGGGQFSGPLVCGRNDAGWRCVQLCTESLDSEENEPCEEVARVRDDGTVELTPYQEDDDVDVEPVVRPLAEVLFASD